MYLYRIHVTEILGVILKLTTYICLLLYIQTGQSLVEFTDICYQLMVNVSRLPHKTVVAVLVYPLRVYLFDRPELD